MRAEYANADDEAGWATEGVESLAEEITAARDAQAGDRRAFGTLYRSFGPVVHAIALARVAPSDVDDLVHDVFVTALRRLDELREPAKFGGWIATIARNRAADWRRRRKQTQAIDEEEWASTPAPRSEALGVLRTIRGLPEAYRETLIMRLVEGMTGPEIAMRTGLTAGSVRVNLHRGMKLLRDKLRGEEG